MGPESEQILPSLGLEILDVMSFIEDHVYPGHAPKNMLIGENQLVGRNADMESVRGFPPMSSLLPLTNVAVVCYDFETG